MQITFGDDAFDAYIDTVNRIQRGYCVALLGEGEEPSGDTTLDVGTDVHFVSADHVGVKYLLLDELGAPMSYTPAIRSWEHTARIHVY